VTSLRSSDTALDSEQRAAVEAKEVAIAVLAGPGSGKTRTLSLRARHLLSSDKDGCALLLTFTNKAAAEMKSRALDIASVPSRRFTASTFHTFCAEVLRGHGALLGVSQDYEILQGKEARQIGLEIADRNGMPRAIVQQFSDARLRRQSLGAELERFGQLYWTAKRKITALDFDDLVSLVAVLFGTRQDVVQAYATKYPHILVDEFQDTNAVQLVIVQNLASAAKTISIFADDDQAIFGFAGAEAANISRFIQMSGATIYPLTVNYRSAGNIVAVANGIIAATPSSSGRQMKSYREGGSVELRCYGTAEEEATDIGAQIAGHISSGGATTDVAVLVRSGWRADLIFSDLQRRGIPVSDWRGESHAPESRRLLAACLATVRGNINMRQLQILSDVMGVEPTTGMATEPFLTKYAARPLARGLSEMRDLVFSGASPYEIARAAQKAVSAQDAELGAWLMEVVESVAHFELYDKEFSLEHLLSELALGSLGRAPTNSGGVKIASLHRTKGLQWKTVYMIGMEEGHHPDFRSASESQLIEERRLCFVGTSRAEHRLVVTWSRQTQGWGRLPSRFLKEMGF
jgi:DNA helicase II / ATP-dependent DNA helicase PcrA